MRTLISVRTEEATVEQLDKVAAALDRNRNWVINEALRGFLEQREWQLSQIQRGIADSDAGRTVSTDQLRQRIAKRHSTVK